MSKSSQLDKINFSSDLSELINAEFSYIAQTAFQSNEDRARVSTFYISSIGSLIAAIVSSQLFADSTKLSISNQQGTAYAFAFLFGILFVSGLITVLQLARLRLAWFKSVEAMNHLKRFCVEANGTVDLEKVFLWNDSELPHVIDPLSLSLLLAFQVIMLTSLMFGTCIYYIGIINNSWWLYPAIWSGIFALIPLFLVYVWAVQDKLNKKV